MLNLITPSAPIAPISADLAQFVNDVLTLSEAGTLADTFAPIIAARNAPLQRTPRPQSFAPAKRAMRTTVKDHAFIRLIACELAIMDAYGDDSPIDGYSTIANVPTIADVNAAYSALRPFAVAVDGLEFGRNSAAYAEALTLAA